MIFFTLFGASTWLRGQRSNGARSKVTGQGSKVKVSVDVKEKAGGLTPTSSCFILFWPPSRLNLWNYWVHKDGSPIKICRNLQGEKPDYFQNNLVKKSFPNILLRNKNASTQNTQLVPKGILARTIFFFLIFYFFFIYFFFFFWRLGEFFFFF